jgi:hypothetical protein
MIARIPVRMAAALALTLGGATPALLTSAAPASAALTHPAGCSQYAGHLVDPGKSISAWDYFQCGPNRTPLYVAIVDLNTDQVVAKGDGGAYYVCNGSAETEYAAAGSSFQAACGGPA